MHASDVDVEARHRVRSADEVVLEIPIAGPTSRMVAYAVDLAVLLGIEAIALVGLFLAIGFGGAVLAWLEDWLGIFEGHGVPLGVAGLLVLFILVQLVVEVVYFVAWELLATGRSPGKMLLGLRVVRDGGLPLTPWASLVRNVLRAVDQLPIAYVTGLVAILLSSDGKRLGDVAAGTLVTRRERLEPPAALPSIEPARVDAVRLSSAQVARLDVHAVRLARATLRRLGTLDADRRGEVLSIAAAALARRLDVAERPADAEAFLHAVVAAFDGRHRRPAPGA